MFEYINFISFAIFMNRKRCVMVMSLRLWLRSRIRDCSSLEVKDVLGTQWKLVTLLKQGPWPLVYFCTMQWCGRWPCNAFTTYRSALLINVQSLDRFFKIEANFRLVSIWVMFFPHLNDLNLGLQGLSATRFNVRDKIEAIIKKLELFSVCINKDNTQVFP